MALTSILTPPTNKTVFVFNRGNTGSVLGIVAKVRNMIMLRPIEISYTF